MANGIGMQLSTGTVVEYKPGERIAVRVSDREVVTLDLDRNVRVDGAVAEGQLAAVLWTGDGGGVRRVNSITAAPGPGEAGTANLASSYREMSEPTRGSKAGSSPGSGPNNIAPPAGSTTPRATSCLGAPTPTPTP